MTKTCINLIIESFHQTCIGKLTATLLRSEPTNDSVPAAFCQDSVLLVNEVFKHLCKFLVRIILKRYTISKPSLKSTINVHQTSHISWITCQNNSHLTPILRQGHVRHNLIDSILGIVICKSISFINK